MEDSTTFRDKVANLYVKCRCSDKEAYEELENLATASFQLSPEDAMVVNGYLGQALLVCKSVLIPYDKSRAKTLMSSISELDGTRVTCPHLLHLLSAYYEEYCSNMERESFLLLKDAADQGHILSLSKAGYCYDFGSGVGKDVKKAFSLYMLAATFAYPVAEYNVGCCHENGDGCNKDDATAVLWYRRAAEQGLKEAQHSLGLCYRFGQGVRENFSEAFKYFKLSAEQGLDSGIYRLAWCYHAGRGVVKDDKKAVQLASIAASRQHALSSQFLGQAYDFAWGVDRNVVECMRHYRQAITLRNDEGTNFSRGKVLSLASEYKEAVSGMLFFLVSFLLYSVLL